MTLQNQLNQVLWHISVTSARPAPALLKQLTDLLINKSNLPLFDDNNIISTKKERVKKDNISHNSTNAHLTTSIDVLIDSLTVYPEYANGLAHFLLRLLNDYDLIELFTDAGILSDKSFSHSMQELVSHRFLPLLSKDNSVVELIDYLFPTEHDVQWLSTIDNDKWKKLIELFKFNFYDDTEPSKLEGNSDATTNKTINHKGRINDKGCINDNKIAPESKQTKTTHSDQDITNSLITHTQNDLLNAMVILSYRITGIGIHPELMDAYPQRLDYTAAFVAQNQETILFVEEYRQYVLLNNSGNNNGNKGDPAPLLVMIDQCENLVKTIRKRIYKTGISIRLTNMLLRLEQSLERLRLLTELFTKSVDERNNAVVQLTNSLIVSAKRRYSIRYFINDNTHLLSRKVTENASRVGEHYISTDKSGYKTMFKKAAIGGFVIAIMATIKILSYDLELAPIGRAFINSMIYGLGFVFIHIIHGTVATKQPAMTAAAIASTISNAQGKKTHQLTKLSELIVDILRTQFVAIMGNVMVAIPIAIAIAIAWLEFTGSNMIDIPKAHHLLEDLDPIHSMALFHAAIAGVYLFLSGLIAGYYDNLAIYNQIGERISRHKLMLKIMPKSWLARLGKFVETNLGAIMGNFLFGVFLGSTATVGYILGLPLDIRHIAFASANFAHGIMNAPVSELNWGLILLSLLGVALIGIINLMVSFSLALLVALRAKEVNFQEWGRLAGKLFDHLLTHPKDFFLPRPEPMQYSNIDSDGQFINSDSSNAANSHNLSTTSMTTQYVIQNMKNKKTSFAPIGSKTTSQIDNNHFDSTSIKDIKHNQVKNGSQSTNNHGKANDSDDLKNNIELDKTSSSLPKPKSPPNLPD